MKEHYVYMHRNKINNKVYIGITSQEPNQRWRKGKGYEKCYKFYNAIQKYGWEQFEHIILFENLTKEEAEQKEIELIKKYKASKKKYGYNIENGGNYKGKHSKQTKQKIRNAKLGEKNPNFGKPTWNKNKKTGPLSEEHRKKLSKIHSKSVICVETKQTYYGMREAERQTQIMHSDISRACRNKKITAGGYHWEYYEEEK